jgi:hypothetical protein
MRHDDFVTPTPADVERVIAQLFLDGHKPRREDRKKALEVAALLPMLAKGARDRLIVEAAAGHGYVALVGAALFGWKNLWLIDDNAARLERLAAGAARLGVQPMLRNGDVADLAMWPDHPHTVVALHACGEASDGVIASAVARGARVLMLAPCCHARHMQSSKRAEEHADRMGMPAQAELRRRFVQTVIDAERLLVLEAAGYEVTAEAFVPPTVTPQNLLLRARRADEPVRMSAAATRLARMRAPE